MSIRKKQVADVWQIETGGHVWYAAGENWQQAIISAWSRKPPAHIGELVRFRKGRKYSRIDQRWEYIEPLVALRTAGYSIRQTKQGIELLRAEEP